MGVMAGDTQVPPMPLAGFRPVGMEGKRALRRFAEADDPAVLE